MKIIGSCRESSIFTEHNFSKWKKTGLEERTDGESSILGGNVVTWHGTVIKQERECKDCGEVNYREEKM